MTKKNILLKLLDNKIIKLSKEQYTPGYFKLDKDLNILYYNKEICFTTDFEKHPTLNLTTLLNHIMQLQKEGFKLEFFDIVLLRR